MDIFSAGCVIAEILMDGEPLFDLAKLQKYRKGIFNPIDVLRNHISNHSIINIVMQMIDKDPVKRPNAI